MCPHCPRPTFIRRVGGLVGRFTPFAVLALMPKCPLCFAAYFTLFTGVGLSLTAATWLRTGLIVVCWAAVLCLAVRLLQSLGKITASRHGELS